jgi:hypothetical protein
MTKLQWLVGLLVVVVLALLFSGGNTHTTPETTTTVHRETFEPGGLYTLTTDLTGCVSPAAYERMLVIASARDEYADREMVTSGRCTLLKKETLVQYEGTNGLVEQVRPYGELTTFYLDMAGHVRGGDK